MTLLVGNSQFQKLPLSGGTGDGRRIKVAATISPGTTIHTGPSDPTMTDEVWIDAHNTSVAAVDLTLQWGGTSADDSIVMTIPPKSGLSLVIPGHVIVGNATALIIRAFASTANVVTVGGYVNRAQ